MPLASSPAVAAAVGAVAGAGVTLAVVRYEQRTQEAPHTPQSVVGRGVPPPYTPAETTPVIEPPASGAIQPPFHVDPQPPANLRTRRTNNER